MPVLSQTLCPSFFTDLRSSWNSLCWTYVFMVPRKTQPRDSRVMVMSRLRWPVFPSLFRPSTFAHQQASYRGGRWSPGACIGFSALSRIVLALHACLLGTQLHHLEKWGNGSTSQRFPEDQMRWWDVGKACVCGQGLCPGGPRLLQ